MPLGKGVRYRVKQTEKGPIRLAFAPVKGEVIEAKNLRSGAKHTSKEFQEDRKKAFRSKKGK